jgi:hypothetical protein
MGRGLIIFPPPSYCIRVGLLFVTFQIDETKLIIQNRVTWATVYPKDA